MRHSKSRLRKWQGLIQSAFFVASAALAIRVLFGHWSAITQYDWYLDWPSLAISCLLLGVTFAAGAGGWHLIMRSQIRSRSLLDNAEAWFASQLAKYLPVGTAWQILGRALLQEQSGVAKSITMVAAFLEVGIYTVTALIVYIVSHSVAGDRQWLWILPFAMLLIAIGLFIMLPPVFNRLLVWASSGLRLTDATMTYSHNSLGTWLLSYSGLWVVAGSGFFFLVRSVLQDPLGADDWIVAVGIFALSSATGYLVIFAPRGLLVREAAIVVLLGSYIPSSIAVAISILARLWYTAVELITVGLALVVLYLVRLRERSVSQGSNQEE